MTSAGDLTFEYDLENRRIQKQDGSQTTTYVQNPNAPLPQVLMKTTGGTTTYYIYGHGLIAEETGTAYRTYHYDYRGSTIALTGNEGLVTDTYAYGPYGELLSHSGTSQVDYLYNGRDGVITDSEDLYYMRARYYSTDLKRFLSEDAFAGKYDNLLGLNLYGYVNGNPVQYVDPSGYFTEQYPGGGGAAGIAGIYITKLLNSPDLYNDLNLAASDYANKDYPALTADVISVFLAGVDAGTIKLGGKSVREFLEALVKNSEDLPAGLRKLFESGSTVAEQAWKQGDKLVDGMKLDTNKALDAAEDFLGKGYKDLGNGRYMSADGTKVVRMGDSDILGQHGGTPHMNFETLAPNPSKPGKMKVIENLHIYLE